MAGVIMGLALSSGSSPGGTSEPHGIGTAGGTGATPLPPAVLREVTTVPLRTLSAVGIPSGTQAPTPVTGGQRELTGEDGKPELLYVGAEYCPFCAAERWALVVALSRFGTFTGLQATHSSDVDIYPDTRTLSFYGSDYSSRSLAFDPVELETNQPVGDGYPTLQHLTAGERSVLRHFDAEPYSSEPGAIPFVDIGNRYVTVGAGLSPSVLSGLSLAQIGADLAHPHSPVARAIDGAANTLFVAITNVTGERPQR